MSPIRTERSVIHAADIRPGTANRRGICIRVKHSNWEAAASMFARKGVRPIAVDHEGGEVVTFAFGRVTDDLAYRIAGILPLSFYAVGQGL
jgi:hypothetical protein